MPTRLIVVPHCVTEFNEQKRLQGQLDIPLNQRGLRQANDVSKMLANFDITVIYSSDLSRCVESAKPLAASHQLEVILHTGLRGRHYGIFEGNTASEIAKHYPDAYAHYKARDLDYDFETGESLARFAARVSAAIDDLIRLHKGQTIAAISHAGVLDIVYRKATGRPLNTPRDFVIPNCTLNWLRFDAQDWHLEAWNAHNYSDCTGFLFILKV